MITGCMCRIITSVRLLLRYFFVAKLCAAMAELRHIIHDDACHLSRFAEKHRCSGRRERPERHAAELRQRLAKLTCVVDKFHASGHVDPWCRRVCSPAAHEE